MAEELERQGEELATPVAVQEEATEPEPTAEPAEEPTAEPPTRVNLDELEEFRSWKSQTDRRFAEIQTQLQAEKERARKAQEERDQYEQYLAQQQIEAGNPEDAARYYQQLYQRTREEQRQAQAAAARQAELTQRALRYLDKVGLPPDTPGLRWAQTPSDDGLIDLMDSAGEILAQRQQELAKKAKADRQKVQRQARQEAIQQTGAASVSTATGGPQTGLQARYEDERSKLRKGDGAGLVALRAKYRKEGLPI